MLAAAHLLRLARDRHGTRVETGVTVTGFIRSGERVTGIHTTAGKIVGENVINAAGSWAGQVASLAGVEVPVLPGAGSCS